MAATAADVAHRDERDRAERSAPVSARTGRQSPVIARPSAAKASDARRGRPGHHQRGHGGRDAARREVAHRHAGHRGEAQESGRAEAPRPPVAGSGACPRSPRGWRGRAASRSARRTPAPRPSVTVSGMACRIAERSAMGIRNSAEMKVQAAPISASGPQRDQRPVAPADAAPRGAGPGHQRRPAPASCRRPGSRGSGTAASDSPSSLRQASEQAKPSIEAVIVAAPRRLSAGEAPGRRPHGGMVGGAAGEAGGDSGHGARHGRRLQVRAVRVPPEGPAAAPMPEGGALLGTPSDGKGPRCPGGPSSSQRMVAISPGSRASPPSACRSPRRRPARASRRRPARRGPRRSAPPRAAGRSPRCRGRARSS